MFGFRIFTIVPEKSVYIVERFGRFHRQLSPGLNFLVPIFDRIAYRQSAKETAISIEKQTAITKDNVSVQIDASLFMKISDPFKASYRVENPLGAIKLLSQTIIRSEIGKIKLDQLLQERQKLNSALHKNLNKTADDWGLECQSVEILQIDPPNEIKRSMQYEVEAERLKRRDVLQSEGAKLGQINVAEGKKLATIRKAEGEAESVEIISLAQSQAIKQISQALERAKQNKVVDYILLSNYLEDYQKILNNSNVVIVPKQDQTELLTMAGNNKLHLSLLGMMMLGYNSKKQPQK